MTLPDRLTTIDDRPAFVVCRWSWVAVSLLLGLLTLTSPLFAADDDIRVRSEVDRAFLTIGDRVTYTVTVEHAPDIQVISRVPPPDSDVLEVKKIEDINRSEGKKRVTGRKFTLTTFKLGEFVLDPVQVNYRKGTGPEKTLESQKIYLTVKSVAEGEPKEDIRDVKSVVPLTRHIKRLVIVLASLAAALLILFLALKMRKKPGTITTPEPELSPEEEALRDLRELFDSDLMKRGFVKLYYLKLSEILRVFLERRYGILAVESTTFEIMRAMKGQELPQGLFEKLQHVLASADLAKFAKWVPTPPETTALNKRSEEVVLESAPSATPSGNVGGSSAPEAPHGV